MIIYSDRNQINMKYLGICLMKFVLDIYIENYKTFLREI